MVAFEIGSVPFNSDGWGPPETPVPLLSNHPTNVPFAPFNRSEKLGRIADWTRSNYNLNLNQNNRNNPNNRNNTINSDSAFDFSLDDSSAGFDFSDDQTYRLVDSKPQPKPKFGLKWRFQRDKQLPQRRDEEVEAKKKNDEKDRAKKDRQYHMNRSGGNNVRRESAVLKSSVDIQPEWTLLEQIPFTTLSKLAYSVGEPEDLLTCGSLERYDKMYDRITPKNEKRLERFKNRNFYKVTTTDDPVIRRLANEDKATVFVTDAILAAVMCTVRSVYSWDIVIQKVGNKLFFDKRDGSQIDMLSVNETSQDPLPDAKEDINSAHSLSVEASYINQNFSQQVLVKNGGKEGKVVFEEGNPFVADGEEAAPVAYKYRRWKLDNDMFLISRCETQSVIDINGVKSYLTLNALNEFDPKYSSGMDWRKKLETQKGAILANELKNNNNKLAKWTAQALLASADTMKLGFVSRIHPRDHFNHVILAVNSYKPKEFANQINMNTSNMWGIVKSIVDLCMKLTEGKYVLVKDPAKPQVRIYEVPPDAFENDYMEEPLPEDEQVQPAVGEEAIGDEPVVLVDNSETTETIVEA